MTDDPARREAVERALALMDERRIDRLRISWCDLHGQLRGKTLVGSGIREALTDGIGMVSTLMLKDSGDRTAIAVFDPAAPGRPPGFGFADNLVLRPDPASFRVLPWTDRTGWMQAQPCFQDGTPVAIDPRRLLQDALARLAATGLAMRCGLEIEFHAYRIDDARLDAEAAAWPGPSPRVSLVHGGYNLLAESATDLGDDVLRTVQHTCEALGLPLRSLEIELGPSQFEAVFDVADALEAADRMVLFRSAVKQALRRQGIHASFMCRPPFPNVMASGWHLHQSLVDARGGNAFAGEPLLSATGAHWLAGLLEHARGACVFATPTINGHGRFKPNAMAPCQIVWGRDNRGAMLRVIGGAATRIENRCGEPAANPYLYIASQVHAGLDGLQRALPPPPPTEAPYAGGAASLPRSLAESLDALAEDGVMTAGFGADFIDLYTRIKRSELARHDAAEDRAEWERREYFARL